MPDLSALFRQNTLTAMLAHVFNAAGPRTIRTGILLRTYVRVVDKALEDYELSRVTFAEFVSRTSNDSLSRLFRATGHMENCLGSIDRAVRFAKRLSEEAELSGVIPPLSVTKRATVRRIAILRNGTEHLDARVIAGTISEGDLSAVWMDEEYLELEGVRVEYIELGSWLSELHALAVSLAHFKPPTDA